MLFIENFSLQNMFVLPPEGSLEDDRDKHQDKQTAADNCFLCEKIANGSWIMLEATERSYRAAHLPIRLRMNFGVRMKWQRKDKKNDV